MADAHTPNAQLSLVTPNRGNWSEAANKNWSIIDAIIGTYFVVSNLRGEWENSTAYLVGDSVVDTDTSVIWVANSAHTSGAVPLTFAEARANNPSFWSVYASPARSRGPWLPFVGYRLNDFVVNGAQYAICIRTHIATASFTADTAAGDWSILIDLSSVGTSVLPVPGGASDAFKFAVTGASGLGYTIIDSNTALEYMGATSLGISIIQATNPSTVLNAIGAQPAGNYQPLDADLTALANGGITAFGLAWVSAVDAVAAKVVLGLGTAASLDVGTTANKVVQLDGSGKLPAVDGSQLTGLATSGFSSGDTMMCWDITAPTGWLFLDGRTIGDGSSGATARANADTANLFAYFWTNLANAEAPVSSGRGANAAADFAAHKTLTLPDMSGGIPVGKDDMSGTARGFVPVATYPKSQTVGGVVGENSRHTLTAAEQASMPVSVTGNASLPTGSGGGGGTGVDNSSGAVGNANLPLTATGTATGGGGSHNIVQRSVVVKFKVKL